MSINLPADLYPNDPDDLFRGMGSYWRTIFGDSEVLRTLQSAVQGQAQQAEVNIKEGLLGADLAQAPVFHVQLWYRLKVRQGEERPHDAFMRRYGDGAVYGNGTVYGAMLENLQCYAVPANLVTPKSLANRITDASFVTYQNAGYLFDQDTHTIGLRFNPFSEGRFYTTELEGTREADLWLYLSEWDTNLLQLRYALALNANAKSDENYLKLLKGLWEGRIRGISARSFYNILSGCSGIPFAEGDETVVRVSNNQGLDLIITDQRVYRVPEGSDILVSAGDQLSAGQNLSSAFELLDRRDFGSQDIYLEPRFFSPQIGLKGKIGFPNQDVAVTDQGTDADGNRLFSFLLYGDDADINRYFTYLAQNGFSHNLDRRGPGYATQPTGAQLVSTINPAIDMVANHLLPNLLVGMVERDIWSSTPTLQHHLIRGIREGLPPRSTLLLLDREPPESQSQSSLSESSESSSTVGTTGSSLSSPSSSSSSPSSSSPTTSSSSSQSDVSTSSSTFSESSQSSSSNTSSSTSTESSTSTASLSSKSSRSESSRSSSSRSSLSSKSESSSSSSTPTSSSLSTPSSSSSSNSSSVTNSTSSSSQSTSSTSSTVANTASSASTVSASTVSAQSVSSFTESLPSSSDTSRTESSFTLSLSTDSSSTTYSEASDRSESSRSESTQSTDSTSSESSSTTPSATSTSSSDSSEISSSSSTLTISAQSSSSTRSESSESSSSSSTESTMSTSSSSSVSSHSQGDFYLTGDLILNGDFANHSGSLIDDWDDNGNYLSSYSGHNDVARLTPAASVISQDVSDNPSMDISGYVDAIETGNVHLELRADIYSTQAGIDDEEIKIQVIFVGGGIEKTIHTVVAEVADSWSSVVSVLPVDVDADEFRVVCRTDFLGDTGYFDNIEARLLDINNMTSSTTESTSSSPSESSSTTASEVTTSSSTVSESSETSSTSSTSSTVSESSASTQSDLTTSSSSISRSFSTSSSSSRSESSDSSSSQSGLGPLFTFSTDLGEARPWGGSPAICAGYWDEEDALEDDTANNNDGVYYRLNDGSYIYGIKLPSVTYNRLEWVLKNPLPEANEEILEMGEYSNYFIAITYDYNGGSSTVEAFSAWNGFAGTDSISTFSVSDGSVIRMEFDASAKTIELFLDDVSQGTMDASYAVDTLGYNTLDDISLGSDTYCVELYYNPDSSARAFSSWSGYYDPSLT